MSLFTVIALTLAIGVIAGLRSLTAPAVVSWAAQWNWINLQNSPISFLGSIRAAWILTALALAELVADKLPFTPARTKLGGLVARIVTGGLCGAALCITAGESLILGAILGAIGAVAGTFAGYELRHRLVTKRNVPDLVVALIEDAAAIGGAFLILAQF
ncbi:MAG TPA: DUF4126 family protein [Bryobacteraceae bacterium]